MSQSRSTVFPRYQKKERRGTNNDKANATHEKKGKRKVQGVQQSHWTAALPRHQEEEETDKTEQTYEKHYDKLSLPQAR